MKILYAKAVYGQEEKDAVLESLDNTWLAAGKKTEEFEREVAKRFGKKYGVAVNSGSSANLLALASLDMPKNSEIITPACTFATTVAPILQNGYIPVFVDSVVGRYTIDEKEVINAITKRTGAILVPQLVGGIADMEKLREIADKYNLYLIDDSCDTFAPLYKGLPLARYSDITTTSFYGSHIITTMGSGGMVMTDDENTYQKLKSLANWGRVGSDNEDFNERFDYKIDNIFYDSKFIYPNLGYNVKMTEGQAVFGLEQLKRLKGFTDKRKHNHERLTEYFRNYKKWFYLPESIGESVWLAYALTIKEDAPFTRYDLLKHLDSKGIQVRVLFSGNITRHPAYRKKYRKSFKKADLMMKNGFLVGCHQGLTDEDTTYMIDSFEEFLCI